MLSSLFPTLRRRRWWVLLGVGVLLVVSALLAMAVGAAPLTTEQVWQFRVPRILLAVLVGMSLASSGSCLQGLFRNPLADPFLWASPQAGHWAQRSGC